MMGRKEFRPRLFHSLSLEEEILKCLNSGLAIDVRGERKAKERIFTFDAHWRGRYCHHKKVRVVYVEEGVDTVVITVYSSYGRFEERL